MKPGSDNQWCAIEKIFKTEHMGTDIGHLPSNTVTQLACRTAVGQIYWSIFDHFTIGKEQQL